MLTMAPKVKIIPKRPPLHHVLPKTTESNELVTTEDAVPANNNVTTNPESNQHAGPQAKGDVESLPHSNNSGSDDIGLATDPHPPNDGKETAVLFGKTPFSNLYQNLVMHICYSYN